jgi:hypothetical protein
MLPTSAELHERSRFYVEAARGAVDTNAKRRLAACACVLALVAEAIERDKQCADANAARLAQLLVDALSDAHEAPLDVRFADAIALKEGAINAERACIEAWRLRAEDLRSTAEQFVVPSAQASLRGAAAYYDQLASDAEEMLRPAATRDKPC